MKLKISLTIAALLVAVVALSQPVGFWGLTTTETATIQPASTNVYYISCEEFGKVSLLVGFKGSGAGNSTVQLFAYRQLGGSVYETTPFVQNYLTLNGTTLTNTIAHIDVQGAAVLKLQLGNTNASITVTNLKVAVGRKAEKEATFPVSNPRQ